MGRLEMIISEDLAFFLPKRLDRDVLAHDTARRASLKDIVESLGIPHTEVGGLRLDHEDAGFDSIPSGAGALEIRGITPPFDVTRPERLRPEPLSGWRFIVDLNVLKLGRYLLFLGYDTLLAKDLSDQRIAETAQKEGRIVLTRDTRLLFRKTVTHARRLRAVHPLEQLLEILGFFGLSPDPAQFFSRCVGCNRELVAVDKRSIWHLLEPKTQKYVHGFRRCPGCGQIFWEGSHHSALAAKFRDLGIL